jgi:hypothetical protein
MFSAIRQLINRKKNEKNTVRYYWLGSSCPGVPTVYRDSPFYPLAKYSADARSNSDFVMNGGRPSYLPIEFRMLQMSAG